MGPRHADCHLPRAAEAEFQSSPDAQTRRDALIKRIESAWAWSLVMAGRRRQLGSTRDSEYETWLGLAVKDFREGTWKTVSAAAKAHEVHDLLWNSLDILTLRHRSLTRCSVTVLMGHTKLDMKPAKTHWRSRVSHQ